MGSAPLSVTAKLQFTYVHSNWQKKSGANAKETCYTEKQKWAAARKVRRGKMRSDDRMRAWWLKPVAAVAAALAGNAAVALFPWPEWLLAGYRLAAEDQAVRDIRFFLMTLVLAPVLEEAVFRLGIFGWFRRHWNMGFWPAAVLSSLAFGIYHGNWIQGSYACFLGLVLAWGCEDSFPWGYPTAVLMHALANLAALAVFG